MRPSTVSSLSDDFRTRRSFPTPQPAVRQGRRIGIISSVALVAFSVWVGWIVGSGRLPVLVQTVKALLPVG